MRHSTKQMSVFFLGYLVGILMNQYLHTSLLTAAFFIASGFGAASLFEYWVKR